MTIDDTVADFYSGLITYQDYRKQLNYYKKLKEIYKINDFYQALAKAIEREKKWWLDTADEK